MVGYNYKIKDLDGETLTDRACHSCGVALYTRNFHKPRHRVADKSQNIFYGN